MTEEARKGAVRLTGDLPVRLFGLPLAEWQARAWGRAGAPEGLLAADRGWVLSPNLMAALVRRPGTALVERDVAGTARLVALHAATTAQERLAGAVGAEADEGALRRAGLTVGDAEALAGAYDYTLRKREAPYALDLLCHAPSEVEARLFQGAYKGVTDFVTKYAWPRPALAVTRLCAHANISPNAVTTASLVLTVAAFWWFMQGQWSLGFAAGWGMTFLDTVDGKLARTTMTSSKWGNVFDHGIDLVHPPFWYWAWYQGALVSEGMPDAPGWLTASLWVVIGTYALGRAIEGLFLHRHGFHIHVWRRADSLMREVTARRNPNMAIFMVCVLAGAPGAGLAAVAIWSVVCTAFHAVRLAQASSADQASWLEGAPSAAAPPVAVPDDVAPSPSP